VTVRTLVAAALAACLAATAACGGSSGPSQPAGSVKVTMTEFKFDPSTISVKSGKATFFLVNSGSVAHNMIVETSDGKRVAGSELVQAGNSSVFTVDSLAAGSYRVICDHPGHEAAGMKGTLSVS
jgi:plastocyanin